MKYTLTREFYIPKGATKVVDKDSDAVAYLQDGDTLGCVAMVFHGKSQKPDWHLRFKSAEKRAERVTSFFKSRKAYAQSKVDRRAQKKSEPIGLEVGDILDSMWGYDQTNIDFYQVTAMVGAKSVKIRKIGQSVESNSERMGSENVLPVKDNFIGEEMTKRPRNGYIGLTSYSSASKWSGNALYQTAFGYGH